MAVYKISGNLKFFNGYNATATIAINKSDTVKIVADATGNPKGYDMCWLMVTGAGTAAVVDSEGNSVSLSGLTVNQIIPFPVTQVKSTGTTATFIGLVPKF